MMNEYNQDEMNEHDGRGLGDDREEGADPVVVVLLLLAAGAVVTAIITVIGNVFIH